MAIYIISHSHNNIFSATISPLIAGKQGTNYKVPA